MQERFTKKVISTWGDKGVKWLDSLPAIVSVLAKQWDLTKLTVFNDLSYNYVLKAYSNKYTTYAVLKIGCDSTEIFREKSVLDLYKGNGCVKLLEYDRIYNALLLEYSTPGTSLKTLFPDKDQIAVAHAVTVMKRLHAARLPESYSFPSIEDWLRVLTHERPSCISQKQLEKARELIGYLLTSQSDQVLLHGDLHHENILFSARDNWLAIDPKGVIGEPAYEVGAFIRNPVPELLEQENPSNAISRRLDLFADLLAVDRVRLRDWSYVQALLAACWATQNSRLCKQFLATADSINSLL